MGRSSPANAFSLYLAIVPPTRELQPHRAGGAHEIFAAALAMGEVETSAAFYAHNLKLVRDVQTLEDKARRTDVLVSTTPCRLL